MKMKLSSPRLFPITCSSCNGRSHLNHLENDIWMCRNCSTKYEIGVPDGYEVCESCRGCGGEPGRLYRMGTCDKCEGTGLISWTEKILRNL